MAPPLSTSSSSMASLHSLTHSTVASMQSANPCVKDFHSSTSRLYCEHYRLEPREYWLVSETEIAQV
jgi:hypothetical protein